MKNEIFISFYIGFTNIIWLLLSFRYFKNQMEDWKFVFLSSSISNLLGCLHYINNKTLMDI